MNTGKESNQPKPRIVDKFYSKEASKLPQDFYQTIIELENDIQLSNNPTIEKLQELGRLYKKAIEAFSGVSMQRVEYFTNKLSRLLVGANRMTQKQKKKTRWNEFMQAHKKNTTKFMIFLSFQNIENNKSEVNKLINDKEQMFQNAYNQHLLEMDKQHKSFLERKKTRRVRRMSVCDIGEIKLTSDDTDEQALFSRKANDKFKNKNDKLENDLKDFIKKFHFIYLRSKIFKIPLEVFSEILNIVYLHKIDKYYYYQEQIKQFELMIKEQEKDGENGEGGLTVFLTDLQNERKSYFAELENIIDNIKSKIKTKLIETNIEEDKVIKKYVEELMSNISQVFI